MSNQTPDLIFDADPRQIRILVNPQGRLGTVTRLPHPEKIYHFASPPSCVRPTGAHGARWEGENLLLAARDLGLVLEQRPLGKPESIPPWTSICNIGWQLLIDCAGETIIFDGKTGQARAWDRGYSWSVWFANAELRDPKLRGGATKPAL